MPEYHMRVSAEPVEVRPSAEGHPSTGSGLTETGETLREIVIDEIDPIRIIKSVNAEPVEACFSADRRPSTLRPFDRLRAQGSGRTACGRSHYRMTNNG